MRGCWDRAISASLSLRETLSTVTGLLEGWKADSLMSGVIDWQPATSAANATAMPKRTVMRAGLGEIASVVGQVGRTCSFLAAIRSMMTDQRYAGLNKNRIC